jgi:hypothetical protein
MGKGNKLTDWLSERSDTFRVFFAGFMAFLTYACMYGLRKPFTACEFSGLNYLGIDYKTMLIIIQLAGYAISKFAGIKIISEMKRNNRLKAIILLTGTAEAALILFRIVPPPYNVIFLFLNGFPLGLIWGLVFAYLEGRRTTEILGTILSISFIVSSGFVKSVGRLFIQSLHLTDFQMPWITGLVFFIPLVATAWLLDKIPDPSELDKNERTQRKPMSRRERIALSTDNAGGLILLVTSYVMLTIYRDLRDSFAVDIWKTIGYAGNSMILTWSELPIALIVFAIMSTLMFIKNNRVALISGIYIVLSGFVIIGLSTTALNLGLISPDAWMILLGLGTYLGYLPFNCLLFDRLLAASGTIANAGFLIYVSDSFGYLGSIGAMLTKNFSNIHLSWYNALKYSSLAIAITGIVLIFLSALYFNSKLKRLNAPTDSIRQSEAHNTQHATI